MKKLLALVVLALLGFYVAWPAYSGYQIANALQTQDAALLARKIDFESVRASLRPVVAGEVDRQFATQAGGAGGPLVEQLKKDLVPKLVDGTLAAIVTPANILRIYTEGGDIKQSVAKIMAEQMSKSGGLPGMPNLGGSGLGGLSGGGALGGLGGLAGAAEKLGIDPGKMLGGRKADAPATPSSAPAQVAGGKPSYGISNIKRFGFAGPLGMEIGVSKDAAASAPDLTAGLSFTGFDWKLTSLVPRI